MRCDLAVIDVYQQPEIIKKEDIVASPTLIKKSPPPKPITDTCSMIAAESPFPSGALESQLNSALPPRFPSRKLEMILVFLGTDVRRI